MRESLFTVLLGGQQALWTEGQGRGSLTHVCVCTQWGQGTPRASDAGFHFSRGKSFASELDFQGSVRLKKKSSRAGCERGWGPRRQKDLQTPPPTRRGTSRSTTFNEVDLYIQFLNGDMANFKLSVKHFHFVIKVPIFTRNGNTPPPSANPTPELCNCPFNQPFINKSHSQIPTHLVQQFISTGRGNLDFLR